MNDAEAQETKRLRQRLAQQRAMASTFILLVGTLVPAFAFLASWLFTQTRSAIGTTVFTAPLMLGIGAADLSATRSWPPSRWWPRSPR